MICWRRARISASSRDLDRNSLVSAYAINMRKSIIGHQHRPIRRGLPAPLSFRLGQVTIAGEFTGESDRPSSSGGSGGMRSPCADTNGGTKARGGNREPFLHGCSHDFARSDSGRSFGPWSHCAATRLTRGSLGSNLAHASRLRLQEPHLRSALDKRGGAPRALQLVTKRSMVLGRLPLYGEPEVSPDARN